jgi:cold shock CspA family protein
MIYKIGLRLTHNKGFMGDVPDIEDTTTTPITMVIVEETPRTSVGKTVGQCKWFSDRLGYGFLTVVSDDLKGKDIFVHHSGITPLNSKYRTLRKGEYVNFDVHDGENGYQATNVTGVYGGPLMCDVITYNIVKKPLLTKRPKA